MPTKDEVLAEALRAIGFEFVILDPAIASSASPEPGPAAGSPGADNGTAGSTGPAMRRSASAAASVAPAPTSNGRRPAARREPTSAGADTPMAEVGH